MDQGFVAAEAAGIEFTNRAYPARPLYATVSPSEADRRTPRSGAALIAGRSSAREDRYALRVTRARASEPTSTRPCSSKGPEDLRALHQCVMGGSDKTPMAV
jgi:hypothetical protein